MASGKNVAWSQLRVGIVAVWALVLLAVLIFLITGSGKFFQKKVTLHTFLADSSAMTKGANVRVNGILAGRVSKVELSGLTDPRKLVRVDLEVDEEFLKQIPDNSEAAVTAENVLGSK